MPNRKIRIAVIGAGYFGSLHAAKFAAIKGAELTAVCDHHQERAEAAAAPTGAIVVTDHRKIADLADAAVVAVPTIAHYAVAKDCLEAGLDVLIEKPMCETLHEADSLIRLAKKKKRILQVGHLERFSPVIDALVANAKGAWYVESQRVSPFRGRGADTTVILDMMIHDLDHAMRVAGSPVADVEAVGSPVLTETEDLASARIRFQNGCIANVTASRVTPTKMRKIRIFQDGAYISINYEKQSMEVYKLAPLPPSKRKSIAKAEIVREHMPLKLGDKLELQLDHFLDCVLRGERPLVDGEAAMQALDVAVRISEQVKQVSDGYFAAQKMAQAANPIKGLWD